MAVDARSGPSGIAGDRSTDGSRPVRELVEDGLLFGGQGNAAHDPGRKMPGPTRLQPHCNPTPETAWYSTGCRILEPPVFIDFLVLADTRWDGQNGV